MKELLKWVGHQSLQEYWHVKKPSIVVSFATRLQLLLHFAFRAGMHLSRGELKKASSVPPTYKLNWN